MAAAAAVRGATSLLLLFLAAITIHIHALRWHAGCMCELPNTTSNPYEETKLFDAKFFRKDGKISQFCPCSLESIQSVNHDLILPALAKVLNTKFFKHFRVDLDAKCPFWDVDGYCTIRDCGVQDVDKHHEASLSNIDLDFDQAINLTSFHEHFPTTSTPHGQTKKKTHSSTMLTFSSTRKGTQATNAKLGPATCGMKSTHTTPSTPTTCFKRTGMRRRKRRWPVCRWSTVCSTSSSLGCTPPSPLTSQWGTYWTLYRGFGALNWTSTSAGCHGTPTASTTFTSSTCSCCVPWT
jgi:hypothetical protein